MIKEIKDVKVGDIIVSPSRTKYVVMVRVGDMVIPTRANQTNGILYSYTINELADTGWMVEQPLDKPLQEAKNKLESAGFKVTR